jgi:hypothetical protein
MERLGQSLCVIGARVIGAGALVVALVGCASDSGSGEWVRVGSRANQWDQTGQQAGQSDAGRVEMREVQRERAAQEPATQEPAAQEPVSQEQATQATQIQSSHELTSTARIRVVEAGDAKPAGSVESSATRTEDPGAARALDAAGGAAASGGGWLGDRSNLRPSPRHSDTLYEQSARLASYRAFIVEPMEFLPSDTVRGLPIDAADGAALATALREETIRSLSSVYTVVATPGPGVASIRAAITGVAASTKDPVTGAVRIGGASVEMEIVDSVTRERIAAAVESDVVDDAAAPGGTDPYSDARLVFGHWAARLSIWIRDADRLATRP